MAVNVLGLTGGIASGKSTVAELFANWGATIVDADAIVHQLLQPGQAGLANIVAAFGDQYLTEQGALDRRRLGMAVFNSPSARQKLDQVNAALIRKQIQAAINHAQKQVPRLVVAEIPLLIEQHYQPLCDRILVVDVLPAVQLSRLQKRNHLTRQEAKQRLAAQLDRQTRLQQADFCLDNSQDLKQLKNNFQILVQSPVFQDFVHRPAGRH